MSDILNLGYINSLPQPFMAHFAGGSEWPVHTVDVETGLMQISVCGLLECRHIGEVLYFIDGDSAKHQADDFYNEE